MNQVLLILYHLPILSSHSQAHQIRLPRLPHVLFSPTVLSVLCITSLVSAWLLAELLAERLAERLAELLAKLLKQLRKDFDICCIGLHKTALCSTFPSLCASPLMYTHVSRPLTI